MIGLSEYGRLGTVLMKHVREAFVSDACIATQWKQLNFSAPPDFTRAMAEYDAFAEIIEQSGAEIIRLPQDGLNLDSIYTRDASIVGPRGAILCRMGKRARENEPALQQRELRRRGWPIGGTIDSPGMLEGGDLIWVESRTVALGQGKRTNAAGAEQLGGLLGRSIDVLTVQLPDYPGQHDVMHLMSLISPVDADLAVVYPRLLPDTFQRWLLDRGYQFVEVPDAEFESMGTNVLALGPRDCLMIEGNPKTRAALERAGARVQMYQGSEISLKGGGGPTCLTRPLTRHDAK